ncbi:hypothetical protein BCY91_14085 [Pelobium manganitolerans]|uniref:Uncharacterized protein n=1 Tax=Pelobium manganitolerans TaxID=1842495 RepID=A0A419S9U8_9SPHI|nr:hypothetical protein [Pelobium manganitolerans]RKD19002.1 hypothetical protein BCY91_14085 [Pelobium manganitolerans]
MSSQLEKYKRIRTVQEWILEDYTFTDIVRSCVSKWDISVRQAERYYSEAFREFKEKEEQSVDALKSYYKKRKMKLIREMDPVLKKTPSGVRAVNKVLDSMAKLDGIMIDKVELTGKDGTPLPSEVKITVVHSENVPPFAGSENEVDV